MNRRTGIWVVLTVMLLGCEEVPEPIAVECPSAEEFVDVSPVVEKRCGTLDCHGDPARPLKIYSYYGLRNISEDEFNDPSLIEVNDTVPGGKITTEEERALNRRSLCGVEPEKMNQLAAGEITPDELLIIRKPLGVERHKGGELFIKGGAGYDCLASWLRGDVRASDCDLAVEAP